MINVSMVVSDYGELFAQAPVSFMFYSTNHGNFKVEKNNTTVAYYGPIKCQRHVTDMATNVLQTCSPRLV